MTTANAKLTAGQEAALVRLSNRQRELASQLGIKSTLPKRPSLTACEREAKRIEKALNKAAARAGLKGEPAEG